MPIEVIVLAMASASPEAIAARSSCAIVYADNIIDRIACEVYSNPDAYGPDQCVYEREVEVELASSATMALSAKTKCRETHIYASIFATSGRSCTATSSYEGLDESGIAEWEGELTGTPEKIFVLEGYWSQDFEITLSCDL